MSDKKLKKIKSSLISRTMTLAKLSLSAGAGLAGQGLNKIFSSETNYDLKWNEFLAFQAQKFSKDMGELKGSIMKAGQLLSLYGEYFFPADINKYFKTLQQDSPPLHWEAIYPLILKYLGQEKVDQLEINKDALACASLGQVHRAKIKSTKEDIVLKIQYPNIEKAIDSDLKAIKSFILFLKILPKDLSLDPIFSEIKQMLIQESNYELEAKKTDLFRERLKNDSRFIVPKVHHAYSNDKIIATTFEHGLRIDDPLLQNLSLDRRNKLAGSFLDLYFKELFIWHELQTDPHPGNYKIRIQPSGHDQWILYDFGATRSYDNQFMTSYHNMIKGALFNDSERLRRSAFDLNFIQESDPLELIQAFENFCLTTVEPFFEPNDSRQKGPIDQDGNYDWKNTDLPKRLSEQVLSIIKNFNWRTPPKEILFMDRKTGGVFIILSLLGARFKARPYLSNYLQKDLTDR